MSTSLSSRREKPVVSNNSNHRAIHEDNEDDAADGDYDSMFRNC